MSHPDDIDALAVARRILANPRTFRVSTHEELAMADCLVGLDKLLDAADARPTTNARLAACVAAVVEERDRLVAKGPINAGDRGVFIQAEALLELLNTLKATFETEFPQ